MSCDPFEPCDLSDVLHDGHRLPKKCPGCHAFLKESLQESALSTGFVGIIIGSEEFCLSAGGNLLVKTDGFCPWAQAVRPGETQAEKARREHSNLELELRCAESAGASRRVVSDLKAGVAALKTAVAAESQKSART